MGFFRKWHWGTKLFVGLGLSGSGLLWMMDGPSLSGAAPVEPTYRTSSVSSGTLGDASETTPEIPLAREVSPLAHFWVMIERPLFDPSRRTPLTEEDVGESLAQDPGQPIVAFIGTIVDGHGIRALVSGPQGVQGVMVGEEIDGWDIVRVEARRLILKRHAEQIELTILAPGS